jgi:two-component system, sensor histidine kinase and response regulator
MATGPSLSLRMIPSSAPLSILIVDDNPGDRTLYRRLLAEADATGFVITEAESGAEALGRVTLEKPDCILLDYRLPDFDGVEFLAALTEKTDGNGAPVIMLTSYGSESIVIEAVRAGAADYLSKNGLSGSALRRAISNAVEKHRLRQGVESYRQTLKRSNAELEQFAYVASHHLPEPLRMVTSYLQLLERRYQGRLDADAQEFIGYAVDGAKRMQVLINDLLAYSRLTTHRQPLVPIDCEALLKATLADLAQAIAEAGATVTHGPLLKVSGDPTQLGQLFQNLICNALKFRGEKPPEIRIEAAKHPSDWMFSVRDNGIGIEPRYAERVFLIFERLHGPGQYPGTGIGLAICKKIVARHGGRIWVESQPGQGATFYFTLGGDIDHEPESD